MLHSRHFSLNSSATKEWTRCPSLGLRRRKSTFFVTRTSDLRRIRRSALEGISKWPRNFWTEPMPRSNPHAPTSSPSPLGVENAARAPPSAGAKSRSPGSSRISCWDFAVCGPYHTHAAGWGPRKEVGRWPQARRVRATTPCCGALERSAKNRAPSRRRRAAAMNMVRRTKLVPSIIFDAGFRKRPVL